MRHRSPSSGNRAPQSWRVFEALFQSECMFVWRVLLAHGVPTRDAEDVTQDVFIAILRHIDDYDPLRPPRPWLFTYAVRMARGYRMLARHRRLYLTLDEDLPAALDEAEPAAEFDVADGAPDQERVISAKERFVVAVALIERVPLSQRLILVLHDVEGLQMPEIAAQVGIGLDAGYGLLYRARYRIRRLHAVYQRTGTIPSRRARSAAGHRGAGAKPSGLPAAVVAEPLDPVLARLLALLRPAQPLSPPVKRRMWLALCAVAGLQGLRPATAAAHPSGVHAHLSTPPPPGVILLSLAACLLPGSVSSPAGAARPGAAQVDAGRADAAATDADRPGVAGADAAQPDGSAAVERSVGLQAGSDHPAAPPLPSAAPAPPSPALPAAPAHSASPPSSTSGRALLVQARLAMQRGSPQAALRLLDAHERQFPQSPLEQEREVIRIEALIQAGQPALAAERREAFQKRHPGSILLPGFQPATPPRP